MHGGVEQSLDSLSVSQGDLRLGNTAVLFLHSVGQSQAATSFAVYSSDCWGLQSIKTVQKISENHPGPFLPRQLSGCGD